MMNSLPLIRQLKKRTGDFAVRRFLHNWPLYNWTLGGTVPDGFITTLHDQWPGNPEYGQALCAGHICYHGETRSFTGEDWQDAAESPVWFAHLHGFSWLRDLKAFGGDQSRLKARALVQSWIETHFLCDPQSWAVALVGDRLSAWAMFYDYFGASAHEDFQIRFFESYARQARHLSRNLNGDIYGLEAYRALRGLAFAGVALQGRESWLEQALDRLQDENARQILADGGHISRSPAQLLGILKIHIELRTALGNAGYPVPAPMQYAIDRMAQAIRFFRFADRKMALFHGTQEGDVAALDMILSKANARGKVLTKLPQSGYERLGKGRSVVMLDTGMPPAWPDDAGSHASPLAFEFCYGKERVFVSCGAHPLDPVWQDALRATAAHNTLDLDFRNSCEIRDGGHIGRKPAKMSVHREENNDAVLVEASHDGYVPVNGITHRRKLYLGKNGHDFRGEENLTCTVGLGKPVPVNVRFHLHPRVQVSLIRDGHEALIRLQGGAGWRFHAGAGSLRLENSVYFGTGTQPRKTKQIIIEGVMESDQAVIKWALQREGG